jgi:hypothetical protein
METGDSSKSTRQKYGFLFKTFSSTVKCNDMFFFILESYSKARKRVKRFTANPSLLWEESGSELIVNGTRDVRPVNFSDYDYEVTNVRRWKKGASNNRGFYTISILSFA